MTCLERFSLRADSLLQPICGLTYELSQKLRPYVARLGKRPPVGLSHHAGIAFAADVEGKVGIDALDGARAHQVIERRQAGCVIRPMQQGEVLGMAIGVARQDIEDLPAQQVLRVDGRLAGGLLHQTVALREGRSAMFLILLLVPVTQGLAEILLV